MTQEQAQQLKDSYRYLIGEFWIHYSGRGTLKITGLSVGNNSGKPNDYYVACSGQNERGAVVSMPLTELFHDWHKFRD